ncbi:MAG: hypothetical protein WBP64_11680 [Nitrososphaeraceae archaeon]
MMKYLEMMVMMYLREVDAMGEGFGGYNASSFFAETKPLGMRSTLGNWDTTRYIGDEPPCLRRLDSNKKFPKDLTHEPHDDGEIWSACMYEIRTALGRKTTDTLVIPHHFVLSRSATFQNAANALITADKNLNGGRNQNVMPNVFIHRGILPNQNRKNKRAGLPFDQLG